MTAAARRRQPEFGIDLGSITDARWRDLTIRFAFGALVSAVAGALTVGVGGRAAGMMLAFPAILPATLTLIEEEESERAARDDDTGAVLGAAALAAFGAVAWWLLPRHPAPLALTLATVAWIVGAVGLYLGFRFLRR
jgi:uncharacterized membrane protein (GlpM family)